MAKSITSHRLSRTFLTWTVAIVIVLAVIGAYCSYWVSTGRFVTIEKGHFYRAGAMAHARLLRVCRRHGIRTVIDFREEQDLTNAEARALAGIDVRHVGISSGQVPTPETVAQFLAVTDDKGNYPILVHCNHGVGRAGVYTAIYRMEYDGWPAGRANSEARLLSGFDSFGKRSAKTEFLANYKPRARDNSG